ncbi:conserved hypothetical protein [Nitrosopumilaceae archaeon]|nr:conserved hypothetical protein [Nitrosopumilaceae archaeon]
MSPSWLSWYAYAHLAALSIPGTLAVLFGQTIPGVLASPFRMAGEYVVLGAVFVFALAWILRARPRTRPTGYEVVVFDVFGSRCRMEGIRTRFRTHDVAWSYMRQYKEAYPLNSFALVSDDPGSARPTIFRYI